jgi:SAM-dependent methyltransferase
MIKPETIWNQRYARANRVIFPQNDAWLDRWRPLLATNPGQALDIGCGDGFDTEILLAWGFSVTAVDVSAKAIALSQKRNPAATHLVLDVQNIGQVDGDFDLIVAGLSLHYFSREETESIFDAIYRLLVPGGFFVFRVNAFDDAPPSAPASSSGWECVLVDGIVKQFFSPEKIDNLLKGRYLVFSQQKLVVHRYGTPKSLFEVVAKKSHPKNHEY